MTAALPVDDFENAERPSYLSLFYQPIVCAHTGRVFGAEALARRRDKDDGVQSAAGIVEAVERSGGGPKLDRWVVRKAIRTALEWRAAGCYVPVHVNVCGTSFLENAAQDFYEWFLRLDIDYSMLTIEITETDRITDHALAAAFVQRFRLLGMDVAIDDFGCGYSTLELLQRMPTDLLKIDRRFVACALHDSRSAVIVRRVIELAHELGTRTVAEGVETMAEWTWLRDVGCDFIQGYVVSAAMPGDHFAQWHRGWKRTPTAVP
jgi:diguanylate cyclase